MSDESCFIDPDETVTLPLGIGQHAITVKRELGFGEEQALAGSMMGGFKAKGDKAAKTQEAEMGVDLKKFAVERFHTWIVAWTLTGKGGKPIPVSRGAIENLRGPFAEAIDRVLDEHIGELEEAKKALAGTSTPAS